MAGHCGCSGKLFQRKQKYEQHHFGDSEHFPLRKPKQFDINHTDTFCVESGKN